MAIYGEGGGRESILLVALKEGLASKPGIVDGEDEGDRLRDGDVEDFGIDRLLGLMGTGCDETRVAGEFRDGDSL
jgi:hypothetical protein